MSTRNDKPLGVIHVDLGPRNRAEWSTIFKCTGCGKILDQNTEVFGEYRRHNARMGILEWRSCCSSCGEEDSSTDFVRASKFNGPIIELNNTDKIIKLMPSKNRLIRAVSIFWFHLSLWLGIERID